MVAPLLSNAAEPVQNVSPGTGRKPFRVGAPCLQAPGETTMGVSWAVSGLAKGVVEYATTPAFKDAVRVSGGGFGLVPIDADALQVRLEGLKPATRYYYRTITTPFADYANIYEAKLGEPIVSATHSFRTMGADAPAHFAAINDTHAIWKSLQPAAAKVKSLKPAALIWNGDATNSTQDKRTATEIFLDPPIADRDFMADVPTFFESGNHDFRGSWIAKKEEVVQARHPAERRGDQWDLKWNFAQRLGELALIGLDTGEDKPDRHPKWFGLANFEPYRRAQAAWLAEALARPDIAAAKCKVVFCHIPLFAAKDHPTYPHDGTQVAPRDFARWSRECQSLWAPLFVRHGVRLVVAAHNHAFRYDAPTADRPWAQVVGGGPKAPTVIEGRWTDGRLNLLVHDVLNDNILLKVDLS